MKIVCREHVDLSVPVERAFAFATDIARWPMWFGCMVNVHLPESQELELGAVLRICLADGRRRRQETFEVTRYVRNASAVIALTVAAVPTGMNAGVSSGPCAVCRRPARARPSVAKPWKL